MLVKSLVAGTVLTLLAGGVVYYGTDVDGHISSKNKVETSEVVATDVDEAEISETTESEDTHPHSDKATCLLYTSPSPRDATLSRMPSSA